MSDDDRPGIVRLDAALDALLKSAGLLKADASEPVFDAWHEIAGADLAPHCVPLRFARGELMIEVRSAALLHELENFRAPQLLASLQTQPAGTKVTRLAFKAQS